MWAAYVYGVPVAWGRTEALAREYAKQALARVAARRQSTDPLRTDVDDDGDDAGDDTDDTV